MGGHGRLPRRDCASANLARRYRPFWQARCLHWVRRNGATLVPAIADQCEHVTLLQRSPTYFFPAENRNEFADELRRIGVSDELVHELARKKALFDQDETCQRCLTEPDVVKAELFEAAQAYLGPDFDLNPHFTPKYRPWQQRLAFIPDGDLFKGIASGAASVVTDEIERFTPTGLQLKSGAHLDADIIVTATGFNLSILGGIPFEVDGEPVDFSQTVTYRGMMFTGVPNMAWVFGYFRASWTLRVDLMGDFVCRLLNHMDATEMGKFASNCARRIRVWSCCPGWTPTISIRDI